MKILISISECHVHILAAIMPACQFTFFIYKYFAQQINEIHVIWKILHAVSSSKPILQKSMKSLKFTHPVNNSGSMLAWMHEQPNQQHHGLKKSRARKLQFSKNSCKFPTQEIMDAYSFNFAPKFPHNGGFQPKIQHSWTKNFQRKKFPQNPKFEGKGQLPHCHEATAANKPAVTLQHFG